jgi:hypothetical protein
MYEGHRRIALDVALEYDAMVGGMPLLGIDRFNRNAR